MKTISIRPYVLPVAIETVGKSTTAESERGKIGSKKSKSLCPRSNTHCT